MEMNRPSMKAMLRMLLPALLLVLCSGCSTLPNQFDKPPVEQAKAVVFDVDGTLTPMVWRFWQVRDDAAKTAQQFADQGYHVFYVTARFLWLQWPLPDWLEDNDFPAGSLYVPQTWDEHRDPEHFKHRILQRLIDDGWQLEWAFGDSSSDFKAYASVQIPKSHVFALQRENADECESGVWDRCLKGWAEFLQLPR